MANGAHTGPSQHARQNTPPPRTECSQALPLRPVDLGYSSPSLDVLDSIVNG
jgi:hypothetical protein